MHQGSRCLLESMQDGGQPVAALDVQDGGQSLGTGDMATFLGSGYGDHFGDGWVFDVSYS